MKLSRWLVLGVVLAAGGVQAAPAVHYEITPERVVERLTALRIEIDVRARPGRIVTLDVPDEVRSRLAPSAFTLDGGQWIQDPVADKALAVKATSSHVRLTYRLLSDGDARLQADGQGMAIHARWFAVRGEEALVVPRGGGAAKVDIAAVDGWTVASNLTAPVALAVVGDSQIIGGADYRLATRRMGKTLVRLAYPASLTGRVDTLGEDVARLAVTETAFWKTPPKPVFVGLVALRDDGELSGRGMQGGFSLYLGKDAGRKDWQRLIAHEGLHGWISRAIGGFPETNDDLEAWLHEGFTEAYTGRMLRAAGIWTQGDYVGDWNTALARYDLSPVKAAPNSRILADRNRDFDVNRLPYDRGRLLAVMWDRAFRGATQGRVGLDDVLRAQMAEAGRNARARRPISADRLFPVVAKRLTGLDIRDDIRRYVDDGTPISLPAGAFGQCLRVVSVTQPTFDRGFDLEATGRAHGKVAGLEPGGPAEKAGLKAGDRIRIDEVPTHDARVTLRYRVDDGNGKSHVVSYRPEGRDTVTFRQLAPAGPACRADAF